MFTHHFIVCMLSWQSFDIIPPTSIGRWWWWWWWRCTHSWRKSLIVSCRWYSSSCWQRLTSLSCVHACRSALIMRSTLPQCVRSLVTWPARFSVKQRLVRLAHSITCLSSNTQWHTDEPPRHALHVVWTDQVRGSWTSAVSCTDYCATAALLMGQHHSITVCGSLQINLWSQSHQSRRQYTLLSFEVYTSSAWVRILDL